MFLLPSACSFARNVDVETSPDADTPRPCGVALLVGVLPAAECHRGMPASSRRQAACLVEELPHTVLFVTLLRCRSAC